MKESLQKNQKNHVSSLMVKILAMPLLNDKKIINNRQNLKITKNIFIIIYL